MMTDGVLAGEKLAASVSKLTAATTVVTPEETRLAAAVLTETTKLPPRLREATDGRPLLLAALATQFIPEMLLEFSLNAASPQGRGRTCLPRDHSYRTFKSNT